MSRAVRGRRFDLVDCGGQRGWILDVTESMPLHQIVFPGGGRWTVAAGPSVIKVSVAESATEFSELKHPRQLCIARRRLLRRELQIRRSSKRLGSRSSGETR